MRNAATASRCNGRAATRNAACGNCGNGRGASSAASLLVLRRSRMEIYKMQFVKITTKYIIYGKSDNNREKVKICISSSERQGN